MASTRHDETEETRPTRASPTIATQAPATNEKPARPRRRWRVLRVPAYGLLVTVGSVAGALSIAYVATLGRLNVEEARARRLGLAMSAEAFAGPRIPDDRNAAPALDAFGAVLKPFNAERPELCSQPVLDTIRAQVRTVVSKERLWYPAPENPGQVDFPKMALVKSAAKVLHEDTLRAAKRGDAPRVLENLVLIDRLAALIDRGDTIIERLVAIAVEGIGQGTAEATLRVNASAEMVAAVEAARAQRAPSRSLARSVRKEAWYGAWSTETDERLRDMITPVPEEDFPKEVTATLAEGGFARDALDVALRIPVVNTIARQDARRATLAYLNDLTEAWDGVTDPLEARRRAVRVKAAALERAGLGDPLIRQTIFEDYARGFVNREVRARALDDLVTVLKERARTGSLPLTGPSGYVLTNGGKGFMIRRETPEAGIPSVVVSWPDARDREGRPLPKSPPSSPVPLGGPGK